MNKRHPLVPEVHLPIPAFPPLLGRIRAMEKESTLTHMSPFEGHEDSWARHWYPRIGAAWQRLQPELDPDGELALGSPGIDVLFLRELRDEIHEYCVADVRPRMLATALECLGEKGHYVLERCERIDGLSIHAYGPSGRPTTDEILAEFALSAPQMKYLESELAVSLEKKAQQLFPNLPWALAANGQNW